MQTVPFDVRMSHSYTFFLESAISRQEKIIAEKALYVKRKNAQMQNEICTKYFKNCIDKRWVI